MIKEHDEVTEEINKALEEELTPSVTLNLQLSKLTSELVHFAFENQEELKLDKMPLTAMIVKRGEDSSPRCFLVEIKMHRNFLHSEG